MWLLSFWLKQLAELVRRARKAPDQSMRQRLVYYACRLIDQMSQHSQEWDYGQIKRVYAICLMNYTYERDPRAHSTKHYPKTRQIASR